MLKHDISAESCSFKINIYSTFLVDYCFNVHPSDEECEIWARDGQCVLGEEFMMKNCRKVCDPACIGTTTSTTSTTSTTQTPTTTTVSLPGGFCVLCV